MVCIDINHTTKVIRITDDEDCPCPEVHEFIGFCIEEWEKDGYHVSAQLAGLGWERGEEGRLFWQTKVGHERLL